MSFWSNFAFFLSLDKNTKKNCPYTHPNRIVPAEEKAIDKSYNSADELQRQKKRKALFDSSGKRKGSTFFFKKKEIKRKRTNSLLKKKVTANGMR